MSGPRQTRIGLFPMLVLGTILLAMFSWWRATSATSNAETAETLLAECHRLASRIEAARGGPTKAEENRRTEADLAQQIEAWCLQAGVEAAEILRIDPLTPRRMDESSYVEQGARVELRSVTLPQLAEFSEQIRGADVDLSIGNLRLTAPRGELTGAVSEADTDEVWQGEFALTYFVYSPKSPR